MKSLFDFKRLPVQMTASFILVVLLTAVTVGLPGIWLLQNQLERQGLSQFEQGQRIVLSRFSETYLELQNLAILTAQRPTLHTLMNQGQEDQLTGYLVTLQNSANVNLINLCRHHQQFIAGTDASVPVCDNMSSERYFIDRTAKPGEPWMIARTQIDLNSNQGEVVVGIHLGDSFAVEFLEQTELQLTLFIDEQPVSTSFQRDSDLLPDLTKCLLDQDADITHLVCDLGGIPYYVTPLPLEDSALDVVVALDISEIFRVEKRLVSWMAVAMSVVVVAGITLGVVLSRRINRPLVKLANAAAHFSLGNFESPVEAGTKVREITQLALALDSARLDLLATLTSLESERDWIENLLASIVEGIIALDAENRIIFFSRGAERLTGQKKTEVIGSNIDDIFQLAGSEQPFSSILPAVPGGSQNADVILDEHRIVSFAITSAELGRSDDVETEIALVFRDISEEEAVHRLLGYFIANFAHELRTPLTALEASIELLLDQESTMVPGDLHQLYNSLHLGILRLHTLVDNLLESANIEARRFRISPRIADLGGIIAEAIQTMQPLLAKYEQRFTTELPAELPPVKVDHRRTVQVLVNLISNAIRYGPPGEEIDIRVRAAGDFLRLEVMDRGPGILPEHRANLFRRFEFPHDDDAVSQAGAGLGLSVVKAIVQAHGGDVGVEDRPGGGSIFWFTIPVASEEI